MNHSLCRGSGRWHPTTPTSGSAERWGPLWGARPQDWAANEEQQLPTYEEAIRRVGIGAGQRVLDVGCGSACSCAPPPTAARACSGSTPRRRCSRSRGRACRRPTCGSATWRSLPYDGRPFDLVTGFNSFFFAADMVAALREAGRVAKPGAPVVIQVWGRPERCDLDADEAAVAPFLPPRRPGRAARRPPLWQPGVLEGIAAEAGLTRGRPSTSVGLRVRGRADAAARACSRRRGRRGDRRCRRRRRCAGDPRGAGAVRRRTAATGSRTSGTSCSRARELSAPRPARRPCAAASRVIVDDPANASTPSSTSCRITMSSRSTPELAQLGISCRAASTSRSTVRAAVAWARAASIVASGIVLTVSGPISSST